MIDYNGPIRHPCACTASTTWMDNSLHSDIIMEIIDRPLKLKNALFSLPTLLQVVLLVSGVRGGSDSDTELEDQGVDSVFSPSVTATCRAGVMNIVVETNNNFLGAVHARDYRRPACTNYGQGTSSTSLKINLLADQNTDQYCGVFVNKVRHNKI